MLRVGLTGGIASGKSVVARRLAEGGMPVLDLDRLAHELMAPGGPAHAEVVAAFGPGILAADGAIDRSRLGALVFRDAQARERLNGLVHPRVREAEAAHAAKLRAEGATCLVTEAALLVEAGLHLRFDRLVVAVCPPEVQVERLRARDGLDEAAALARLGAQMPVGEKRRFAHHVLNTTGTLAETGARADALAHGLAREAGSRPVPLALEPRRVEAALASGAPERAAVLSLTDLADHLARHDGLDLGELARQQGGSGDGPWYRREPAGRRPGRALDLVLPVVLHELQRHGFDEGRLAAAAHTLWWLFDPPESSAADPVFGALALAEAASRGSLDGDLEAIVQARYDRSGERFASAAEPSRTLRAALRCAREHPTDAAAARRAAAEQGAPPGVAGALVALG